MAHESDLVIRSGLVVDGAGGEPFVADVAVADGRIVEVGSVKGTAREEIDATGMIVTPGFIDLHTHLDGHVTWESRLIPTTGHGITTCVIGNCGVGFAPVKPEDRDTVIRLMETVEDMSFEDLTAGLPWDWESFPEYLDAIDRRKYNQDVAALVPHSTLRSFVMGERALSETASDEDLARIRELVTAASRAGAIGFGSSTLHDQMTGDGRHIPSFNADEREFQTIAEAMAGGGGGVLQVALEFNRFPLALDELRMFARIAKDTGQAIMFSLKQTAGAPDGWRKLLELSDRANEAGATIYPQVLGRPTGAIMGLSTTMHPFAGCPSFAPLAKLPLAARVAAMHRPELRAALIEEVEEQQLKRPERVRGFRFVFPLSDPPNYEPTADECVDAIAERRGVSPTEAVYDLLLEQDGNQLLMLAGGNYAEYSLEPARAMLLNKHSVPGLGDAGAHAGIICDASTTTTLLSYWVRDRERGMKLPLPAVVKWLTSDCARAIGLDDRGIIAPGKKADINVIDLERLSLCAPRPIHDLPAGGIRLVQNAVGYAATIVNGEIVVRDDKPTDALPGRLVRRRAKTRTEHSDELWSGAVLRDRA
jgi:N-acyl-D-amino-acid deacylase